MCGQAGSRGHVVQSRAQTELRREQDHAILIRDIREVTTALEQARNHSYVTRGIVQVICTSRHLLISFFIWHCYTSLSVTLRCMGTLPSLSAIFSKGDNFRNFLFAYQEDEVFQNRIDP